MSRALIPLVFAVSLGAGAIQVALRPTIGRTAEPTPHFVERASPAFVSLAITIL